MLPPTMMSVLREVLADEVSAAIAVEVEEAQGDGETPKVHMVGSTSFMSGLMIGLRLAQLDDGAARTWYEALRANAWGDHRDEIGARDDAKVRALAAAVRRADG